MCACACVLVFYLPICLLLPAKTPPSPANAGAILLYVHPIPHGSSQCLLFKPIFTFPYNAIIHLSDAGIKELIQAYLRVVKMRH